MTRTGALALNVADLKQATVPNGSPIIMRLDGIAVSTQIKILQLEVEVEVEDPKFSTTRKIQKIFKLKLKLKLKIQVEDT